MRHNRLLCSGLVLAMAAMTMTAVATPPTRKIVLVAGPDSIYHAPSGHAYYSSMQYWTNSLAARGHNETVVLVGPGWPSDMTVFNDADAVVLYGEGGGDPSTTSEADHSIIDRYGVWDKAMQVFNRGIPVAMVHYVMQPEGGQNWDYIGMGPSIGTNQYLRWIGGYYGPNSWNNMWTPASLDFPANVINQGISTAWTFNDEWYANLVFAGSGVSPYLQVHDHPNAVGTQETVGWSFTRTDGTRGFGFSGFHWKACSADANDMALMGNAVEWLAHVGEDDHYQTVLHAGSTWKYFVGTPAGNWSQSSFDDSGWSSGAAPLGYDDWNQDWIATTVNAGSSGNRPITTWFRKTFTVPDLANVTNFQVRINADDGAVVYLNGSEIGRYNMPGGTVTSATQANSSNEVNWGSIFMARPYAGSDYPGASQGQKDTWSAQYQSMFQDYNTPEFNWGTILAGLGSLLPGTNVLAVEVHQKDTSNPDMRLDVEAKILGNNSFTPTNGIGQPTQSAPSVNTGGGATAITTSSATLNGNVSSTGGSPTTASIVWGTSDAGTALGSWQHVVSLGSQPAGAVSANISGLTGATPYFYRVYASNVTGAAWSSAATFSTKVSSFIAYNDVAWIAGQLNNKITLFGIDGSTGSLVDYTTGIGLDAQVTMSGVNAVLWPGTGAGYAPAGTPAAQMLPTNIIDSVIHYYFDSATMTVSNLIATNLYTFVLYANRDGGYTDRYTTVTIQGADAFINNSTVGASGQASTTSTIYTGSSHGNVFRFDGVNPGTDGTVVFQLTGYKPCLNSFMVQTPSTNVVSTNQPPPSATTNLIAMGASWQYFSTGNLPATNWSAKGYSDGGWSSGPAPLGYANDTPIMTTLPYGGVDTNKWITYYFRKHFAVTNTASVTGLVADFVADDGAVIYLNGAKVFTSTNMIEPVSNTSLTTAVEPEPYVAKTFTIAPSGLATGDNVLAVEVHQNSPGSSDVSFDLALNTVSFATTNQVGGGQQGSTNGPPPAVTNWTAYNDTAWHQDPNIFAGQGIDVAASTFTTNSPIGPVNGALRAFTGEALPVSVSFSGSAVATMLARDFVMPVGTDAEGLFAGKIGTNNAANWTSGTLTMTLSGLTTTKQYTVAIWSTRGGTTTAYSNRWTDITIKSVDSFANNSSVGLTKLTSAMANDETRVVAVMEGGKVARYDQVRPGADGTVVFDLTANGLASGDTNGYLNAFMVTEANVSAGSPGDADSDGMPDSWEQSNFGSTSAANGGPTQDFDGDGVPNLLEFIAGTSPTSGSSHPMLDHPALTNGAVMFDMPTTTGRIYSIDYRSNMTSSAWLSYTSFLGSGSTTAITNNRLDPRLYYRFRIRMQNP